MRIAELTRLGKHDASAGPQRQHILISSARAALLHDWTRTAWDRTGSASPDAPGFGVDYPSQRTGHDRHDGLGWTCTAGSAERIAQF